MSLFRHGETKENEVKSPENDRKKTDGVVRPICEDDRKKLTPQQEFRDKYRVPEDKLNKPERSKISKPNESDDRPGEKGGNGRERFEHER